MNALISDVVFMIIRKHDTNVSHVMPILCVVQSTAPRKNPVPNAAFIIAPLLNALGIPHEPTASRSRTHSDPAAAACKAIAFDYVNEVVSSRCFIYHRQLRYLYSVAVAYRGSIMIDAVYCATIDCECYCLARPAVFASERNCVTVDGEIDAFDTKLTAKFRLIGS